MIHSFAFTLCGGGEEVGMASITGSATHRSSVMAPIVLGMTSESAESLTSKVLQQKTPRAWSEDMQCVMERSRDGGQPPPPRIHGSLQRRVRHCGEDIQEGWKWTSEGWADRHPSYQASNPNENPVLL